MHDATSSDTLLTGQIIRGTTARAPSTWHRGKQALDTPCPHSGSTQTGAWAAQCGNSSALRIAPTPRLRSTIRHTTGTTRCETQPSAAGHAQPCRLPVCLPHLPGLAPLKSYLAEGPSRGFPMDSVQRQPCHRTANRPAPHCHDSIYPSPQAGCLMDPGQGGQLCH